MPKTNETTQKKTLNENARRESSFTAELSSAADLGSGTLGSPNREDISRRAYELYCDGGYQNGHDVEHWLQAERELGERTAF